MRLASILLLLVAASTALAGSDAGGQAASVATSGSVTEIRLGQAPPPPPSVDPSRVKAVERFLAARQEGSLARAKGRNAKLAAAAPKGATAEELYGPKGARLVAFDFQNESLEPVGAGRFQATAYLLFADAEGQVVESRDETLLFASLPGSKGAWGCVGRTTTASMAWDSDGIDGTAESLGVSDEIREARVHLRDWTVGRGQELAYSVADIAKEGDGRVVVRCLRFTADPGHRGFDVNSAPLVLSRDHGVLRVESN